MYFLIFLSFSVGLAVAHDFEVDSFEVDNFEICVPPRKCVQHYQCFGNGTFNRYGENIIYRKFRSEDVKHVFDPHVIIENPLRITLHNDVEPVQCTPLERCCGNDPAPLTNINQQENMGYNVFRYKGCGYINQNEQTPPWIVTLVQKNPISIQSAFLCGGSLIHRRVILTAAHCVNRIQKTEYKVRTSEPLNPQERNINEIRIHEYYDSRDLRHDISLVFVDHPFELNANVQPICLAQISLRSNSEIACYANSWDTAEIDEKLIKSIVVNVVPATKCQMRLKRTRLGYGFELHRSFMCATRFEEQPTSNGDGGLPLVCPMTNETYRYYQSGIISWGIDDVVGDFPDVYLDVAAHRIWIDRIMVGKNFGTDSYTNTNDHDDYV